MPAMPQDEKWMGRCLELARQALALSNPNPRVGCVLLSPAAEVLGEGYTQQAGGPHAEIMALRQAQARGLDTRGATAYVSLEPCAHYGRTPPCCDALIAAKVARVVAALRDPNPLVAGQGFARLRAAGIAVTEGVLASQAQELNPGFWSRITRKRPWVRIKAAASLDGVTALHNGVSQWITGPVARIDGQHWRARACAVLTGVGTVLYDDPQLNVRDVPTTRQPHLAVVDSRLRTPPSARLFDVPGRQVIIYTASEDGAKAQALRARGANIVAMPTVPGREALQVDLQAVMAHLGSLPVNELHVEAGAGLNGALQAEGLADEWLVYLAPKIIGQGKGLVQLAQGLQELNSVSALQWRSVERVGDDLRLLLRQPESQHWLDMQGLAV